MNRFLVSKSAIVAFAFIAAALAAFIPAPSRADDEAAATASADTGSAPSEQGHLVGLAFAGRSVSNLDRSVAFYEALGFRLDPAAPPVWRHEEVFQRIDGIANARGVTTRMAKMYVDEPAGGRFVIYLRELKDPKQGQAIMNQLKTDYKGTKLVNEIAKAEAAQAAAKKTQDTPDQ